MKAPTTAEARERLATVYALDHLWGETMGLPDGDSKEGSLRLVAQLLERERVPYALIGGVAVQLHTQEPRSTLDIDLAVPTYAHVPRAALLEAGFDHTGRHDHSDNWRAPGPGPLKRRTAVQFSAEDEGLADAVEHASIVDLDGGVRLRVATVADLVVLELAAAAEPSVVPASANTTWRTSSRSWKSIPASGRSSWSHAYRMFGVRLLSAGLDGSASSAGDKK